MNRYLKVLLVAAILLCFVGAASAKTENGFFEGDSDEVKKFYQGLAEKARN